MVAENETEINDQVDNGKISVDQLWSNILSNNAKNQLTLANKRTIILGELLQYVLQYYCTIALKIFKNYFR